MSIQKKIRVLVVDDSAVVRRMISDALSLDPEIEVVGAACDPYVARDMILQHEPDVLTLDIEMPRMDGLTFLKILQEHRPMPVVIVSSLTSAGSKIALRAMELGAVDVVAKQSSAWNIGSLREQLAHRVKGAARARLSLLHPAAPANGGTESSAGIHFSPRQLLVIGASTGGTEAIKNVLSRLPAELPGICIVQHIPPVFSKTFAERLNECCALGSARGRAWRRGASGHGVDCARRLSHGGGSGSKRLPRTAPAGSADSFYPSRCGHAFQFRGPVRRTQRRGRAAHRHGP
jgi:two-component system chemotaxis response regulator CheB